MSRYAKAIAALLGAIATWGVTAASDSRYDQAELWGLLGVIATAALAFQVPNDPPVGEAADPHMSERGVTVLEVTFLVVAACVVLLTLSALGVID